MARIIDYRLPENRREGFIRWYVWSLRTTEVDPALSMLNYIFKRMEFNLEQKYWIIWLYGNTYNLPTAYMMWNEFPDYNNVDILRLIDWNNKNYKNFKYQTDTKYNKGFLPDMFKSYRTNVGDNQHNYFMKLCNSEDRKINYENVRKSIVNNFFKFGRYCTFYYMQMLRDCVNLPIEAPSLLFGKDSESHTNGICYAISKDEWLTKWYNENDKKHKTDVIWTPDKMSYLDKEAESIILEIKQRFSDVLPEYFSMETCLCSYKKLFRRKHGRYLGYYLDRQAEEIKTCEQQNWYGVDWDLCWDYRKEKLHPFTIKDRGFIDSNKMKWFMDTGRLYGLEIFDDLK